MLYFLLAAIGVVLLLPTGTKKTSEETEQPQETAVRPAGDAGLSVQEEMEQRLCDALSQMDGVGSARRGDAGIHRKKDCGKRCPNAEHNGGKQEGRGDRKRHVLVAG